MAVYVYRAVDERGSISRGRLPALNPRELESRLRTSGLELLKATAVRKPLLLRARPPMRELINFCLHMETTLKAGLMVTEALEDQVEGATHSHFRDVMSVVLLSVREGSSFSAALQGFPEVFGESFVGMIRSGEEAGRLSDAFQKLGETLRWQDELNAQMKKMIMYPAFTITILIAVTVFMLVYLVPELASFIRSMNGGTLPIQTLILLTLSEFVRSYWLQLLIAPFALVAGIHVLLRIGGAVARSKMDAMKLSIPVVGGVMRKILLARFCSLLGMLYESGLPVIQAITVARDAVGNRAIASAIDAAIAGIEQGKGITESFTDTGLFPNLMLRMIRIGERTGEVEQGLKNVSYFYNRDIQQTIARIQAATEPTLTLALGIILAWLMMSVLGPIYDLLSRVGV